LEDDTGGEPPRISLIHHSIASGWSVLVIVAALLFFFVIKEVIVPGGASASTGTSPVPLHLILTPFILGSTFLLGCMSAFFSASEVAFLSLNKVELRKMGDSENLILRMVARIMKRPGSLLTTVLMGNTVVNILLTITFADPLAKTFRESLLLPSSQSYALSVVITTCVLLFFCEILPKVFAAMDPRSFAISAVVPLFLADKAMALPRYAATSLVGFVFKITGLSQIKPAPFLTDDEFLSILSEGEASGIIEEDERQMIEGILEFSDMTLRNILVPRPDIVGVKESASVIEALEIVRNHEYSRMPVYRDDLDHITGILYAKDLLPVVEGIGLEKPITVYMRPPHFVPETMIIGNFIKMAQRLHIHIAVVVDEYGGTEGIVTLQDALREVVGDIGEEDDLEESLVKVISNGIWQIAGNYPLDEFENLTGISSDDDEHTTVGGFLMALSDKILEPGDELDYSGLHFEIKDVDKKRVTHVLVKDLRGTGTEQEMET
jgi:putative hemolysin